VNAPDRFFLPDTQALPDARQMPIQKVGVKDLRYPARPARPRPLLRDPRIGRFSVASENFESIHNHSAYAQITGIGAAAVIVSPHAHYLRCPPRASKAFPGAARRKA
jgi:GTP cyclohydrolase FolE2